MGIDVEDAADKVRGALVRAEVKFRERDDHLGFQLGFGSSMFYIRVYPMPQFDDVAVEIFSWVLSEMELTDDLTAQVVGELDKRNSMGRFGCLWLHRAKKAIVLEHHLWASGLHGDELAKTIYLNAERADRLDDELKELFNTGRRSADDADGTLAT